MMRRRSNQPSPKFLTVLVLFAWILSASPGMANLFDGDGDGLPDQLELALAEKYFPTLNLHCGRYEGMDFGDRRQLYGHSVPGFPDSSNGRLPFVARPFNPDDDVNCTEEFQCIEIRYGIAWNWDLGDDTFGGAHAGDSEMYAVLLARKDTQGSLWGTSWSAAQKDVEAWRIMHDFRSAHWMATGDSSTFQGRGRHGKSAAATVWCSEGKHAMYPSQKHCNKGGFAGIDDCSDNRCELREDLIQALQNVGEEDNLKNALIPAPNKSPDFSPTGTYDVWSGEEFGDATSYKTVFTQALDWCHQPADHCIEACYDEVASCATGEKEVGGCLVDCGFGLEYDGVLCRPPVACY